MWLCELKHVRTANYHCLTTLPAPLIWLLIDVRICFRNKNHNTKSKVTQVEPHLAKLTRPTRTIKSKLGRVHIKKPVVCRSLRVKWLSSRVVFIESLWIMFASVMASRMSREQEPVQSEHFISQWCGQSAAKCLVGSVGDLVREQRDIAG